MNKKLMTVLTAGALICATGCVTAGTWVNGCYIDGPLCTVCDGMKVVTHVYGTTICTHCDGTGVEPPEGTVVIENVIVENRCPLPPPRCRPRPCFHVNLPRHHGGVHHNAKPIGGRRPARNVRTPAPHRQNRPPARRTAPAGGRKR